MIALALRVVATGLPPLLAARNAAASASSIVVGSLQRPLRNFCHPAPQQIEVGGECWAVLAMNRLCGPDGELAVDERW